GLGVQFRVDAPLAHHDLHRIAGDQADQRESQQCDAEKRWDQQAQATGEKGEHGLGTDSEQEVERGLSRVWRVCAGRDRAGGVAPKLNGVRRAAAGSYLEQGWRRYRIELSAPQAATTFPGSRHRTN